MKYYIVSNYNMNESPYVFEIKFPETPTLENRNLKSSASNDAQSCKFYTVQLLLCKIITCQPVYSNYERNKILILYFGIKFESYVIKIYDQMSQLVFIG